MKHNGFTLLELSIVLVIIGLIVGGVLVGRDLIRAAEIRRIVSDVDNFKTAINTFRLKYNCIPGDCLYATDFFGTDTNGCPNGGGTGTCNGNGDGYIEERSIWEAWRAWQQLSLSSLIPGSYSGHADQSISAFYTGIQVPGVNAPLAHYAGGNASYMFQLLSQYDITNSEVGYHDLPDITFEFMILGGQHADYWANSAVFSSSDGLTIDMKIDDGRPGTGTLRAGEGCADTIAAATAKYLHNDTPGCVLGFILWH